METIHKKNGRLHIYVRQDKYKGELKSHNWVGRTYINGKQKVSSSGTTNLEEAIPILEKWFDDLQNQKNEVKSEIDQSLDQKMEEKEVSPPLETQSTETVQNDPVEQTIQTPQKGVTIGMLEKLKNIKFSKSKEDVSANNQEASNPTNSKNKDNKIKSLFKNFFQSKVSKLSVAGEEIAGLDITKEAVRVAQVSQDRDEKWILDKFSYRLLDQEVITDNVLEHKDYLAAGISTTL